MRQRVRGGAGAAPVQYRAGPAVQQETGAAGQPAEADQPPGAGRNLRQAFLSAQFGERGQWHVRVRVEQDTVLGQARLAQEAAGRFVGERRGEVDVLEAHHPAPAELLVQQPGMKVQDEA